jgi:hypothetical protein
MGFVMTKCLTKNYFLFDVGLSPNIPGNLKCH